MVSKLTDFLFHFSNCDCEDWEEFTVRNKTLADNCINASLHLRAKIDSLIRQSHEDIQQQICNTNRAFDQRMRELYAVKEKLQTQLHDVKSI